MSADALLDALDPEQRAVATALTGPVCVLAGAGTGKTRAITHRIAYGVRTGVYRPASVLAVTFTARAAGEMRVRLRDLGAAGVQARTFHAAALRQLGHFWPRVVGGAPPRLLEQKAPIVAEAGRRVGVSVDRVSVRDLSSEIEWAKVSLVTAEDYQRAAEAVRRPTPAGQEPQAVARMLTAYEDVKAERGVIDFEDVLLLLAAMLAQRGEVADEVRAQYRHLVVDEYQDVSPLQQHLLDQWLGGRHDVCVVGDPSQTIYSFAGASPHHLMTFTRKHPRATVVRLVRDYRSTPQVVGLANRVLTATRRPGDPAPLHLVAQQPDGPPVRFTAYDDDEAEAAGVAARASRLIASGVPASEIAVLYRTNVQAEAFEQALAAAGVGYQVRGGERFFSRRDVRDALVLLRGGARAADPGVPLGETARDVLTSAGWAPAPPAARGAARERWDAMQALVGLADDLAAARPGATLVDLVAELDERAAAQHAPTVDGVTLASLHAAKGLEWDAVFLVGLSEGLMPISLAQTDAAVAEERRLLYVGVTRARRHLELSYAAARTPGSRAGRRRSRFLDGLWAGEGGRGGRAAAADVRAWVAGAGRPGAAGRPGGAGAAGTSGAGGATTGGGDRAVLDRLRAWRAGVAAERGVPAFRVLPDVALEALAAAMPTGPAELQRVHGLGQTRLREYGPDLLRVVAGDDVPAGRRPAPRS